jgi:hypothetical protein
MRGRIMEFAKFFRELERAGQEAIPPTPYIY